MSEQYLITGQTLTDIADAIREKAGITDPIMAGDFAEKILALEVTASGPNFIQAEGGGLIGTPDVIEVSGINFQPKTIVATNARILYEFDNGGNSVGGFFYAAMNLSEEKNFPDSNGWIVAAPKSVSGTMNILQETYTCHTNIPIYNAQTGTLRLQFGKGNLTSHGGDDVETGTFVVRIYG